MTARIFHADLYGTRKHKYDTLLNLDVRSIAWQELSPNAPFYLFRPQEQELREEYEQSWAIIDVFPVSSIGIVTARDALTIHFTEEEVKGTVEDFANLPTEEARLKYALGEDVRDWKVELAQKDLKFSKGRYTSILYRPFDNRHTYYTGITRGFHCMPRSEVMRHMMAGDNIGLITTRMTKDEFDCSVCKALIGHKALAAYDANYLFPLWLYPEENSLEAGAERRPNLNPAFVKELAERVGEMPTPEAIFYYAYAVFHAPTYRERYAPFLKIDFPRLPLPADADSFHELAALGAKLVALHLLEAPELQPTGIAFPVSGDHLVEKRNAAKRYLPPTPDGQPGRVCLNVTEYFDNVPPEAWEFRVGGYQPAYKWLDDRAGRHLTEEDIAHYRKMLAAMQETVALLPAVDAAFRRMLGR
ncbi:MAG TPA: type ISP restriction/modification enzyme [Chthonomonadaceae bacterium]|nr:type ISP restriction/modification enzyme [Chthonomonadaceae bacterium]